MRTKEQIVKRAAKVGVKRQKRGAKVESKKRNEKAQQVRLRKMTGVTFSKNILKKMMGTPKDAEKGVVKQSVPKALKPYRIIRLQAHVEKLQAGVRDLDHSDPKRAKMVRRLEEIKRKLGK